MIFDYCRRMFPILKIRIGGLDPQKKYAVMLTIVPIDEARYKFCNGRWAISGRAEPHFPVRYFIHPDSPSTGKHWTESVVSFHRVKLTNNNKDQSGNVCYNKHNSLLVCHYHATLQCSSIYYLAHCSGCQPYYLHLTLQYT